MGALQNFALVALAMLAFAGNTLLCRLALKGGAIDAATVQLSVPVIAALGGIVLLGEAATWPLALSACAVMGGIGMVIWNKR